MVVIQNALNDSLIDEELLINNIEKLMHEFDVGDSELLIRIVSPFEIQSLNKEYRSKDKVTNVLSFASDIPQEVPEKILGDVVICAELISQEAIDSGKKFSDHITHLVIHGLLHILGYDHQNISDANKMESIEIDFLQKIGISNPYQ